MDPFFSHRDREAECFWQRSQDAAGKFNIESVTRQSKMFVHILTILLNVFIGRLNVSEILRAGAFFGLLLGVCTAQHLMNIPIKMRNKIPMSTHRYQFSITYCFRVCSVSLFSSRFFNRTNGPSASTARHFKNTSQYPWKLSHGAPKKEQQFVQKESNFNSLSHTWTQADSFFRQSIQVAELTCRPTRCQIISVLTCKLTQSSLIECSLK